MYGFVGNYLWYCTSGWILSNQGECSFRRLYVLSDTDIGCVVGRCIGLANFLPTIIWLCKERNNWYNGGEYFRYHYHTWTVDDWYVNAIWEDTYRGIIQCNASISDISKLNPAKFGFSQQEFDDFISQTRVLRAWMYMSIFDLVHNIPIVTDYPTTELPAQSEPKENFCFYWTRAVGIIACVTKKRK